MGHIVTKLLNVASWVGTSVVKATTFHRGLATNVNKSAVQISREKASKIVSELLGENIGCSSEARIANPHPRKNEISYIEAKKFDEYVNLSTTKKTTEENIKRTYDLLVELDPGSFCVVFLLVNI